MQQKKQQQFSFSLSNHHLESKELISLRYIKFLCKQLLENLLYIRFVNFVLKTIFKQMAKNYILYNFENINTYCF